MNARELVELAGLVAEHGRSLLAVGAPLETAQLEQYWVASKCRHDRWTRRLRAYVRGASDETTGGVRLFSAVEGVVEEILMGEVLSRLWSGLLVSHDARRRARDASAIARSVMASHLEARHQALALLVDSPGVAAEQAVSLNRLRRRSERWSDLLLGYLLPAEDVAEFAVCVDRAQDFSTDLDYQRRQGGERSVAALVSVSLRAAFQHSQTGFSPNPDLNARIAGSVLSSFSAELFDSTGQFRSFWNLRLSAISADVAGLVEDLLQSDHRPAANPASKPPQGKQRF